MRKAFLSSNAVNSGYDQAERCLSAVLFALLTCWHVQFSKIFAASFFLHELTFTCRQNLSCEKISKSQNSEQSVLVFLMISSLVNIASSVQKVSYIKPLHNKPRCLNTMLSFLTFKVINTWIFLSFQKVLTMKLWQNTQFTTAILFCFIFTYL